MIGVPPATAASKSTWTPLSRPCRMRGPCRAMTSLLAVHDVFAGGDAPEDVVKCGVLAAHQLDDHVDIRVGQDVFGVRGYQTLGNGCGPGLCRVPNQNALQFHRAPDHACQVRTLFGDCGSDAGAHNPGSQQPNSNGILTHDEYFLLDI